MNAQMRFYRKKAVEQQQFVDDELEIDEDARVSLVENDEGTAYQGAWVQAWVYVEGEQPLDEEERK